MTGKWVYSFLFMTDTTRQATPCRGSSAGLGDKAPGVLVKVISFWVGMSGNFHRKFPCTADLQFAC